jgi:hypothetical protein
MKELYLRAFAWVARKVFGKTLENRKTSIVAFLTILTGLFESFSDGAFYGFLCNYISFFCDFTQGQFYLGLLTVVGIVAQIANAERTLEWIQKQKQKLPPSTASSDL